jgi:hypothetical protein
VAQKVSSRTVLYDAPGTASGVNPRERKGFTMKVNENESENWRWGTSGLVMCLLFVHFRGKPDEPWYDAFFALMALTVPILNILIFLERDARFKRIYRAGYLGIAGSLVYFFLKGQWGAFMAVTCFFLLCKVIFLGASLLSRQKIEQLEELLKSGDERWVNVGFALLLPAFVLTRYFSSSLYWVELGGAIFLGVAFAIERMRAFKALFLLVGLSGAWLHLWRTLEGWELYGVFSPAFQTATLLAPFAAVPSMIWLRRLRDPEKG